jgi:hypothetical protein
VELKVEVEVEMVMVVAFHNQRELWIANHRRNPSCRRSDVFAYIGVAIR